MMNQQPDNFFQEKLKHYQKPAPAAAWGKIEARMQKKTEPRVWLRFASSLLFLLGIGYALWIINSKPSKQPLTQIEALQPVLPDKNIKKLDSSVSVPPVIKEQSIENNNVAETQVTATKVILPRKKSIPDPAPLEETEPGKNAKEGEARPVVLPTESLASAASHNVVAAKKSTITLTFTADETDKYLNKNALAEATHDEKKSSTFKKLLQKANDLKSNQDPFGDLREKKNEILALNFKNEKRGQNK